MSRWCGYHHKITSYEAISGGNTIHHGTNIQHTTNHPTSGQPSVAWSIELSTLLSINDNTLSWPYTHYIDGWWYMTNTLIIIIVVHLQHTWYDHHSDWYTPLLSPNNTQHCRFEQYNNTVLWRHIPRWIPPLSTIPSHAIPHHHRCDTPLLSFFES